MLKVDIKTPILNDRTRSVHFFNGQIVSAEDFADEQIGHRAVHELLGRASGDGVVAGLRVTVSPASTARVPVLRVDGGLALNARGEPLLLAEPQVDVNLFRPPSLIAVRLASRQLFEACQPPGEAALGKPGLYVLTIGSVGVGDGTAPFGGVASLPPRCNMHWIVDAVRFCLYELNVDPSLLNTPALFRNLAAYVCFDADRRRRYTADPFGPLPPMTSAAITECDVPLALLHWNDNGLQFVDTWSVRRRCASGSFEPESLALSPRADAVAEAMRGQFDDHLGDLEDSGGSATLRAIDHFRFLPPGGLLPVSRAGGVRFDFRQFFAGKVFNEPVYIEGGDVEAILRNAAHYPPIDLLDPEMVWLYFVRENRQTAAHRGAGIPRGYVLFANANLPFFGEPRYDRSHFDYSNYL